MPGLGPRILSGLEKTLRAHAGLELPAWVIESRASARMTALGMDPSSYLDLVTSPSGSRELAALVEAVRVGETRFFRHGPHFDALADVIIPAWRDRGLRRPRVWSAGCATGEEPYSLALVLAQEMPRPTYQPSIVATDVSADAIAFAKQNIYPEAIVEQVPKRFRRGLEPVHGGTVRVAADVASMVTFERKNLADLDRPRGFDLVMCRNVLIYFDAAARRRVVDKLVDAIEPGGYLFVGYSESLRDVPRLRALHVGEHLLFEKPAEETSPRDSSPALRPSAPQTPISVKRTPLSSRATVEPASSPISARASRVPERASAPPAVVRATSASAESLATQITAALRTHKSGQLTVDLDGADYLGEDVAPVLRRARAAAETAGVELVLVATRPGPKRWLRRHGFVEGES